MVDDTLPPVQASLIGKVFASAPGLDADFGADTDVALLDSEPDRVSGWFTFVWGATSAKTFNIRLTALGSAFAYWRDRQWLAGDPLIRLRARHEQGVEPGPSGAGPGIGCAAA